MKNSHDIAFRAVLRRKDPRLPVYVVVPNALIASWRLHGTSIVEGLVNGHATGRRTIKRWDSSSEANWFVEFTAPFCKSAGISVGDELAVSLSLASEDVPPELDHLLDQRQELRTAWDLLSEAKKRAAMEHIRSAKSHSTRQRRAALVAENLTTAAK